MLICTCNKCTSLSSGCVLKLCLLVWHVANKNGINYVSGWKEKVLVVLAHTVGSVGSLWKSEFYWG